MKRCGRCKVEKPVEGFWKNQYACKPCQHEYRLLFRKEAGNYASWASGIAKLGLTVDDYVEMLKDQGGVCAICKRGEPSGRRLAVDHNHHTKKVRGLLCRSCNMGIGLLQDDHAILTAAAGYLVARIG